VRILWLVVLLSTRVWAEPLRLQLYSYEGREYTCHIQQGRCWYECRGKRLAERALKAAELAGLEKCLQQQHFDQLPAKLSQATCDSADELRVWRKGKARTVRATTFYSGPKQAEFRRFQSLVKQIRSLAPIPGQAIEEAYSR